LSADEERVQVGKKDMDELLELLDGYKTMLLAHERRIGIIEKVLVDAANMPPPNRRQRRMTR
jgi:hypothetical protein